MLPVYSGAYTSNRRSFQIVINGRTGAIQGDRPYSFWKNRALRDGDLIHLLIIGLVLVSSGQ